MIFNKSKKAIKIVLSTVLIMALLASLSLSNLSAVAETTTLLKATDDHSVVSDVATNVEKWKGFTTQVTTSTDENTGIVSFNFTNGSSTKDNTAYAYVDGNSEYSLNQRVKASWTYDDTNKNLLTLFSRYRIIKAKDGERPIGYVAQLSSFYDSNTTISYTRVNVYKWTVNSENSWQYNVLIGQINIPFNINMWNNAGISLEMVVTDTDTHSTNITVNLYKNKTLAANTVIIDDDTILNQKGTVAISSSKKQSVTLTGFEYTTTDNVAGNNLLGSWADQVLYQRVPLTAGKSYILEALVSSDVISASSTPIYAKYITAKGNSFAATATLSDLTIESLDTDIVDEFNHIKYKITVPDTATATYENSYMCDSQGNYFVMGDIGLITASGGKFYSDIKFYADDDATQSNFLVNSDFKMARYGWIRAEKNVNHNFGFFGHEDGKARVVEGHIGYDATEDKEHSERNVKSLVNKTNWEIFGYLKKSDLSNNGDANCDKEVNICDLVETDDIITKGDYIGTVDMDKNSAINTDDFNTLRTNLLNS